MESLLAVNRYLRITCASGGFAWAPAGFELGCAKIRPGGCLGAAGRWRPLRISTGLTQAFQNEGRTSRLGRLGSLIKIELTQPGLEGLNKPFEEWDLIFCHHNLHNLCDELEMNHLLYPEREYITQIGGFDRSKGIPDVIELCSKFCGYGALDDQDAEIVYNETIQLLRQSKYDAIDKDVIVVRIWPSGQKALHHGKPVVATGTGGIPLQIEHAKSGFLVDVGDTDSVATHLFHPYTNDDLSERMSNYAKASVGDEVGTVGNAACWLYLTEGLAPVSRWIGSWAWRGKKRARNMSLVNGYFGAGELILWTNLNHQSLEFD
ncbi:hypothetical protein HOY80DRAFT_1093010 [Tuber brumale]|nr:hypothetical protein HOY80DRAFT_1093010 [Tuber brumale]